MTRTPRSCFIGVLSIVALSGCTGTDEAKPPGDDASSPGADARVPDGSPQLDGGVPGDDGATPAIDAGVPRSDAGRPTLPTEFRGIPQRPYADVELPATGTVPQGATSCIGTPGAPAFMIGDGVEFTTADGSWELEAEHCIIANINYRGRMLVRNAHMVEIRGSEVHHSTRAGISLSGTDLAVVDSHLHHARGNNGHGVVLGCGSARVWVGGNLLEYNDEDGFQSGHQCETLPPDEIYFYGNECNNNRENCFDLKWTNRAVASGNHSRRHRPAPDGADFVYDDGSTDGEVSSGSDGTAVVIGSDGTPTLTFLFDNVYDDNAGCVRVEDAIDVYASGELCTNALAEGGAGGYQFDKSGHTRLVGSTFRSVPFMITDDWRDVPVVDEADNVLEGGTMLRQGFNATVNSGTISDADITSAYTAAFGRAP